MRKSIAGLILAIGLSSMASAQPTVSLGTMYGTKCNTDTLELWEKAEQVVEITNPDQDILHFRVSFLAFNPEFGTGYGEILLPYEGVEFLNGFESFFDAPPLVYTEMLGDSLVITIEAGADTASGIPVSTTPVEYFILRFNTDLSVPPTAFIIDSITSPTYGAWDCYPYSDINWTGSSYYGFWNRPNCCIADFTNCDPYYQYTSSTFCEELTYQFSAVSQTGDLFRFAMHSGPGIIDPNTGVWRYTPTAEEAGSTVDIVIDLETAYCIERRTGDNNWQTWSPPCEMSFNVGPNTAPSFISGQQYKFVATTDETLEVNMQVDDPDLCHDYSFSWFPHYQNADMPAWIDPETGTFYYDGTSADTGICYAYVVVNEGEAADTTGFYVYHFENVVCGDVNHNDAINVSDVSWLTGYLFGNDVEPVPFMSGDVNCTGTVNISDVTYLIKFLFGGSNEPPCMGCP